MSRLALHKSFAWVGTAWREPMLLWLAVSAAAHAGVVAFLMTPDTAHERVVDAGGAVAIEIVVVEGPELHAGAESGEDRARESAASNAESDAKPSPTPTPAPEEAPPSNAPVRTAGTTPTETQGTPPDETADVLEDAETPSLDPAAAQLVAAPQTGHKPVAVAATPAPTSTNREPPLHTSIQPAPTPRRKPPPPTTETNAQAAPATSAKAAGPDAQPSGQDTERPPAHNQLSAATPSAGGTRGAAPRGDNPKPVYPFGARRRGEQGRVLLRVTVTPTGAAAAVSIAESSGSKRLDDSALETVRRWRFRPAQRAGTPIAAEVTVPIRFQLR